MMVTVAEPLAFSAGVKVSLPVESTAGWPMKRALLSLVTTNETIWPASTGCEPGEMSVAQPETLVVPESSNTVWSAPLAKLGAVLSRTVSVAGGALVTE